MDPGAKVTYNGVEIGRVATVNAVDVGGEPQAKIVLDVDPKYIELIPKNVTPTSARPRCSATSTSPSHRRKIRHRNGSRRPT